MCAAAKEIYSLKYFNVKTFKWMHGIITWNIYGKTEGKVWPLTVLVK
jgi:hypothetical protein